MPEKALQEIEPLSAVDLKGIFAPMLNPLIKVGDETRLDETSLATEVIHVANGGVSGEFFGANASEALYLPFNFLLNSIYIGANTVSNFNQEHDTGIKVVVGTLRHSLEERLMVAKLAAKLSVDALVVVPFLTEAGITAEDNLAQIATVTDLSLIFYDNPKLTGDVTMDPKWVAAMRQKFPGRIIGVKESAANVELTRQYLEMNLPDFSVMQGDTKGGLAALDMGAKGMVPVEACVNPGRYVNFYHEPTAANFQPIEAEIAERKLVMAESGENWLQYFKRQMVEAGIFQDGLAIGK